MRQQIIKMENKLDSQAKAYELKIKEFKLLVD